MREGVASCGSRGRKLTASLCSDMLELSMDGNVGYCAGARDAGSEESDG